MRETLRVPSSAAVEAGNERRHALVQDRRGTGGRWRTATERDHDRLLYSSAFQRLGGITQVTAPEVGRPFHTRLTHTLKVAQVARRSAERLCMKRERGELSGAAARLVDALDIAATESAALAHDLGHPPFGHLAEQILREKAAAAGGFEGNAQSFRIAVRLAMRDTHPGLDLTRQTLNGMLKYPWPRNMEKGSKRRLKWGYYGSDEDDFDWVRRHATADGRSLEAVLMDWADDITYAVHDLDDFARAGLIPLDGLASDPRELERCRQRLEDDEQDGTATIEDLARALRHIDLGGGYEDRIGQRVAMRSFGSMLITRYIEALELEEVDDERVEVVIGDEEFREVKALQQLTRLYVINRPSLAVIQRGQARVVEQLWDAYFEATDPAHRGERRLLPPGFRSRLEDDDCDEARARLVTDLVASMTESTALALYQRMSGLSSGSVLDGAAHGG
jgi:dGTPase